MSTPHILVQVTRSVKNHRGCFAKFDEPVEEIRKRHRGRLVGTGTCFGTQERDYSIRFPLSYVYDAIAFTKDFLKLKDARTYKADITIQLS